MDCRCLDDYKTYIWCGMPEEMVTQQNGDSVRVTTYFHSSYVQEHLGDFFLAYYNSDKRCFLGFSEPFRVSIFTQYTFNCTVHIGGSKWGRALAPNSFIFAYIFTENYPHQRSNPPPPPHNG